MKKVLFVLLAVLMVSATAVQAQSRVSKTKIEGDKRQKQDAQAATVTQEDRAALKKDGTPDRRFKENKVKEEAAPAPPTKKDGTPDMRYKANRDAAGKK